MENLTDQNYPGVRAERPVAIPPKGWWQISKRIYSELGNDHVQLVSAGVAFYIFLSLFPALAAIVSIYGLVMDPATVESQVAEFSVILPADTAGILSETLTGLAASTDQSLGWGLAVALVISMWSANKGMTALFQGLNIVYNETDRRSFIKRKALTLLFTISGFLAGVIAIALIVGISAVVGFLGLPVWLEWTFLLVRWPILALLFIVGLGLIYKFAPHRSSPETRWVSVGSIAATVLWLTLSILFALYVDNFSSFDETYGSLAAVVITLLWLFLTSAVILIGAEINAEMEHQTSTDTTVGPDKPLGERDAYYADHIPKQH